MDAREATQHLATIRRIMEGRDKAVGGLRARGDHRRGVVHGGVRRDAMAAGVVGFLRDERRRAHTGVAAGGTVGGCGDHGNGH